MSEPTQPSLSERAPDRAVDGMSVRTVAVMAVFVALSVVGALVKIPGPVGSIALDAAPGFFVALGFGWGPGAFVAAVGHLVSAGMAGFPLSLPIHLAIAVGMALCAVVLALLGRRGTVGLAVGAVLAVVLNSVGMGLVVLPVGGWGMYVATVPALLVGSVVNVAIAVAAYAALRRSPLLR